MPQRIAISLSVQVPGGPTLSDNLAIDTEAYDVIEVPLAPNSIKEVQVQPGATGQVQLLLIKSSQYGQELSYSLNNPAGTSPTTPTTPTTAGPITLDRPHLLMGTGAVGLLMAAPNSLYFHNGLAQEASVQILVGES